MFEQVDDAGQVWARYRELPDAIAFLVVIRAGQVYITGNLTSTGYFLPIPKTLRDASYMITKEAYLSGETQGSY